MDPLTPPSSQQNTPRRPSSPPFNSALTPEHSTPRNPPSPTLGGARLAHPLATGSLIGDEGMEVDGDAGPSGSEAENLIEPELMVMPPRYGPSGERIVDNDEGVDGLSEGDGEGDGEGEEGDIEAAQSEVQSPGASNSKKRSRNPKNPSSPTSSRSAVPDSARPTPAKPKGKKQEELVDSDVVARWNADFGDVCSRRKAVEIMGWTVTGSS